MMENREFTLSEATEIAQLLKSITKKIKHDAKNEGLIVELENTIDKISALIEEAKKVSGSIQNATKTQNKVLEALKTLLIKYDYQKILDSLEKSLNNQETVLKNIVKLQEISEKYVKKENEYIQKFSEKLKEMERSQETIKEAVRRAFDKEIKEIVKELAQEETKEQKTAVYKAIEDIKKANNTFVANAQVAAKDMIALNEELQNKIDLFEKSLSKRAPLIKELNSFYENENKRKMILGFAAGAIAGASTGILVCFAALKIFH